eukprot:2496497-Ditylum_brightwellii.AAC.1
MLFGSVAVYAVSTIGFDLQKSLVSGGVSSSNGSTSGCGVSDSGTCDGGAYNSCTHVCCAPAVAVQDNIVTGGSAPGGSEYVGNVPGSSGGSVTDGSEENNHVSDQNAAEALIQFQSQRSKLHRKITF